MNKFLVTTVFVALLLNACTPVVSIPTAPAGSELVFSLSDGRSVYRPVWSPTGQELAFTTFDPDNGKGQIYISNLITNTVGTLGQINYVEAQSWSPDGKYIAYNSLREIYVIPLDESSASKHISSGQVGVFSPDGKQMAIFDKEYNAAPGTYLLKILDLDTSIETVMFSVSFGKFSISDLSWSPDGKRLAISLPAETQVSGKFRQDIYTYDLEKEELLQLTFDGANFSPTWSPDGKQIAYLHERSGTSSYSIIISRADGSCKVTVPDIDNAQSLAWSPDGSYLAYSQVTGIFLLNIPLVFGNDFLPLGPICP